MKKRLFLTITLLYCFFGAHAQWSVLDTDDIPKQTAYKYQPFSKAEWDGSNFATPKQMKWFTEARYGMFIHFGLSAYVDKDISWPICYTRKAPDAGHGAYPDSVWTKWPSKFKLENFDAHEWVNLAKEAGMKYIVVIAKHHDGFHLWDTKFSDFKITNTPFGRDYLKELADACHQSNMPFGIYYSQRDFYHPDYAPVDTTKNIGKGLVWSAPNGGHAIPGPTHKKYIQYQFDVVKELCTKYGKIDIMWFDAAWWGGMFTADMWDAENLTRMIRKLQPDIIINNRASIPGDFDTPEQQVGRYQARPWESALTLNGNWAYSPQPNRSKESLLRDLFSSAQGNGNVLLSWGAHWDGRFDPVQKELLLSMGQWLKKYGYALYGTKGGPWMPGKWGGTTYKGNKVYLYVYTWENGKINLPVIAGNTIVNAKYASNSEKVNFVKKQNEWQIPAPSKPDSIVTLIELTMQKAVSGVQTHKGRSVFEGPEYGGKIKDTKITSVDWVKDQYTIDLKKELNVTGIGLYGIKDAVVLKTSSDGKIWKEAGKVDLSNSEISLTTYKTGAEILGNKIRYIQLNSSDKPDNATIKIYAINN